MKIIDKYKMEEGMDMVCYTPELSFLFKAKLGRQGMIRELEMEFNIIRFAISYSQHSYNGNMEMIDRILVMPLRKLLLESQNKSIVLLLCPSFSMPKVKGQHLIAEDGLNIELAPYEFSEQNQWIKLEDWAEQLVAWFDKNENDLPNAIPKETFDTILDKLKGEEKSIFKSFFYYDKIEYQNDVINVYIRNNPADINANKTIFTMMDKAGYYKLTVRDFIKHLSDKRGAHIDLVISPLIQMIDNTRVTPIMCFALQLIYAAKKQIPELSNYWPEMDNILVNN